VAFGPSPEELYCFVHTFGVLDRPRRVAYTSTQTDPDRSSFETSLEITLEEREGKTLMALVEKGFPNAGVRDMHEAGTPHAVDRVDRVIHALGSNEKAGR